MRVSWTWRSEHRTAVWSGGYTFRPPRFSNLSFFSFETMGTHFSRKCETVSVFKEITCFSILQVENWGWSKSPFFLNKGTFFQLFLRKMVLLDHPPISTGQRVICEIYPKMDIVSQVGSKMVSIESAAEKNANAIGGWSKSIPLGHMLDRPPNFRGSQKESLQKRKQI